MIPDEGTVFGRGLGFPPKVGPDGRLAWSAGARNVRESIQLILLTEPRERLMVPRFGGGLKRFLFQPNTVATHRLIEETITRALGRWEPRVRLEAVTVEADPDDPHAAMAIIRYQLVATREVDRIRLRILLTG